MLELVNAERTKAGAEPVMLGDNIAAQLHAESALEHCFASHWGIDGLKPYMRYSLAGGYQSNAENGHGSDYCITASDGYARLGNIRIDIMDAMYGWMNSPGHRRNLLDPSHKKVNIGLAWDNYNFKAYQHFEGDYVEYDLLPTLEDGVLTLSGTLKNGTSFESKDDVAIMVFYDRAPHPLSIGQVSRTYCYDNGLLIAALVEPMSYGDYLENEYEETPYYDACPDPYEFPPGAPAPGSLFEALNFWQEAYDASQTIPTDPFTVRWITASKWAFQRKAFSVKADMGELVAKHGPGVYSVMLWGTVDGEPRVISQYSMYHDVTPPTAYTP